VLEDKKEFYRSNFNPAFIAKARERRKEADARRKREERRLQAERSRQEQDRRRADVERGRQERRTLIERHFPLGNLSRFSRIVRLICTATDVTSEELFSNRRGRPIVLARQAICYWAARRTNMSLSAIGNRLGRDHTTCLHGIKEYPAKRLQMGRHLRHVRTRS
jgi:chromosomal replication initiation ATPase DnaA